MGVGGCLAEPARVESRALDPQVARAGQPSGQYHRPRAKPPKATKPTSATIIPQSRLQRIAITIPTMTMTPPRVNPPSPALPFAMD